MKTILSIFCVTFSLIGCSTLGHTENVGTAFKPPDIIVFKKDKSRPTVIVAHGCDGLQQHSNYRKWAEYLDTIGYNAVMYDSYLAMGYPKGVCNVDGQWWNKHKDIRPKEADNVAKWIKQQPWHTGKVALIGFSAGGSLALNYSINTGTKFGDNISVLIVFYPSCDQFTIGPAVFPNGWKLKLPTQMHLATADDWTPIQYCSPIKDATEIIKYQNATHAFDMYFGQKTVKNLGHTMTYDSDAHEKSKQKVKEFLQANL